MDHFGIGAAMKGMAEIYFLQARRTGRTTQLLESLKDGDRVVCATSDELRRLSRLCTERNLKVSFVVVSPAAPEKIFHFPTPQGRTIFDHSWVEERFRIIVDGAVKDIDTLQRESSGWGEPHELTQAAAHEIMKYRV